MKIGHGLIWSGLMDMGGSIRVTTLYLSIYLTAVYLGLCFCLAVQLTSYIASYSLIFLYVDGWGCGGKLPRELYLVVETRQLLDKSINPLLQTKPAAAQAPCSASLSFSVFSFFPRGPQLFLSLASNIARCWLASRSRSSYLL